MESNNKQPKKQNIKNNEITEFEKLLSALQYKTLIAQNKKQKIK